MQKVSNITKKPSILENILYQTKNNKLITVLYTCVSTLVQKTDRQTMNSASYALLVEDKCSGSIPFFERESEENPIAKMVYAILGVVAKKEK
jgi:hypothetical protein